MGCGFQGTVTKSIKFVGVGLHSGELVNLEILPLPPNSGIFFQRTDIENSKPIPAHPDFIMSTNLSTSVGSGHHKVSTIEHLMAAFAGLGIDNALVKLSAREVPILDGSAAPFVDKLNESGIQIQHVKRHLLWLRNPVEIADANGGYIRYTPSSERNKEQLEFDCSIDFSHAKVIGKQQIHILFNRENFLKLYEARTFCHIEDVANMRKMGLALGGSLDNAVVVNEEKVLNTDGLRYSDEFVRHKLLDCIGDLALLPGRLVGKISMHKSGHSLHGKFVQKILQQLSKEDPEAFSPPAHSKKTEDDCYQALAANL